MPTLRLCTAGQKLRSREGILIDPIYGRGFEGTGFGQEWNWVCQELHLCNQVAGESVCVHANERETETD